MPIFALRKIEAIKGKQEFDKLIVDDKCPFDEFEKNLEAQYKSELAGIYHYMQDVADLKAVPRRSIIFMMKARAACVNLSLKASI